MKKCTLLLWLEPVLLLSPQKARNVTFSVQKVVSALSISSEFQFLPLKIVTAL